ncbi:YwbE family protein [Vagococcus vulneris]
MIKRNEVNNERQHAYEHLHWTISGYSLKKDQRTGKLTRGHVQKILTNSANHPHGIKVMLNEENQVGRVKSIIQNNEK